MPWIDPGDQRRGSKPTREEVVDEGQVGFSFDAAPSPPTGPAADPYSREGGKPPAFIEFLDSEGGPPFWRALQDAALDAFRRQEERFSCASFIWHYRDTKKVRLNNNFSPWFADMLVTEHPQLIDVIERRKRTKEGPNG